MRRVLAAVAVAMMAAAVGSKAEAQNASRQHGGDTYRERIEPIFESRCIACHSCYNAPCQFNLQSHAGAMRGATFRNVYDATRLRSVPPTRLDIDASTPAGWRQMGFYDVLGAGDPARSLLLRMIGQRHANPSLQPARLPSSTDICPSDPDDPVNGEEPARLGMPYGLPPLTAAEIATLEAWIGDGAPGPRHSELSDRATFPSALRDSVRSWERFLNAADPRQQLVSRYLYEHLFLASLHFGEAPVPSASRGTAGRPPFFRLVRSRTACDAGIDEIATRRPTDALPAGESLFYCLRPATHSVMEKKHIPYALSPEKLARIKSLFLDADWQTAPRPADSEPAIDNPFVAFRDIPVRARYQFLLDDAHFFVATFIKGPVCNGSQAVNSIQEQFFVFFLKPGADSMVMSPTHATTAEKLLVLPGARGSDVTVQQDLPFLTRLLEHREQYRKLRADSVRQLRPAGYALDDIWDGEGTNPNAVLTVFRHDDNAAVVKGAVGDLPKTVLLLDYPLFERLVYNLVVEFDVFGNIGHQVLTRVYMDLIRMEAEELFLAFLPPASRTEYRKDWYRGGLLTDLKLKLVFPLRNESQPTAIRFRTRSAFKRELIERTLFERMSPAVRGPADPINWRNITVPDNQRGARDVSSADRAFQRMASVRAARSTPFARYFPDIALVLLRGKTGQPRLYSIVHNREHENVSWIMGEKLRLAPQQDTLTIAQGLLGAYPNMIFDLTDAELPAFVATATRLRSRQDYEALVSRFGIRRTSPRFWKAFDEINGLVTGRQPIERGLLDLTRYALER